MEIALMIFAYLCIGFFGQRIILAALVVSGKASITGESGQYSFGNIISIALFAWAIKYLFCS